MVIPEEREGKLDEDPALARGVTQANTTVSSRKGGLEEKSDAVQQRVGQ